MSELEVRDEESGEFVSWEEQEKKLNEKAREEKFEVMKGTSHLAKLYLISEWMVWLDKSTNDFYSMGVVKSVLKVMRNLSEGKTPKESEDYEEEITGFQAGCVASTVAHFHERGEEYRKWWNSQYTEEDVEGTINPAIVTIGEKKP